MTALVGNAPLFVDNLQCNVATGQAPVYGAVPVLERRISRDRGATWGPWQGRDLGAKGQRRARAVWLRNGLADDQTVFEFRITDATPWRISSIRHSEPLAGLATTTAGTIIKTPGIPGSNYVQSLDFSDARNSQYLPLIEDI